MGHLNYWFKELKALQGVKQNAKFHKEDAYEHTLLVLDNAKTISNFGSVSDARNFMIAAICHDFGKAIVTKYDDKKGVYTAIDHENAGIPLAKDFVKRIFNDNDLSKYVVNMTKLHMKPHMLVANKNSKDKSYMKLFDEAMEPLDLYHFLHCDMVGRKHDTTEDFEQIFANADIACNILLDKYMIYKELMKQPEVTGADLIKLGIKPGPDFSEYLKFTHNLYLSFIPKEQTLRQLIGQYNLK